jgi:hypothetical protein
MPTAKRAYGFHMGYEVTLKSGEAEVVEGADAYTQEGPLTTFFAGRDGRSVLDSWARRLASFRTADIVRVRWVPADSGRWGYDLEGGAGLQRAV